MYICMKGYACMYEEGNVYVFMRKYLLGITTP